MHIKAADIIEAEPVEFAELRNLLGLQEHILRALAREKEDPEGECRDRRDLPCENGMASGKRVR